MNRVIRMAFRDSNGKTEWPKESKQLIRWPRTEQTDENDKDKFTNELNSNGSHSIGAYAECGSNYNGRRSNTQSYSSDTNGIIDLINQSTVMLFLPHRHRRNRLNFAFEFIENGEIIVVCQWPLHNGKCHFAPLHFHTDYKWEIREFVIVVVMFTDPLNNHVRRTMRFRQYRINWEEPFALEHLLHTHRTLNRFYANVFIYLNNFIASIRLEWIASWNEQWLLKMWLKFSNFRNIVQSGMMMLSPPSSPFATTLSAQSMTF